MARTSVIERAKKRIKIVEKFRQKRESIKDELKTLYKNFEENYDKIEELTRILSGKFPRDASPSRKRNRCKITGRPRGVYRKLGIGRNKFRELAMQGDVPGLVKSSW